MTDFADLPQAIGKTLLSAVRLTEHPKYRVLTPEVVPVSAHCDVQDANAETTYAQ